LMKAISFLENRRQVSLKERSVYNHQRLTRETDCSIPVASWSSPVTTLYTPRFFSPPNRVDMTRPYRPVTHTHNKRGAQRRAWVWEAQSRSRPEPPPFSPPIRQNLGGVVGDEPLTPPHKVWRENRAEGFVCDRRPTRNARTLGEWNGRRPLEVVSLTHSHTHTRTGFNSYICVIYLYKFIHVHHNFFSKVIFFYYFGVVCVGFSSSSFLFYTTHSCCCCSFVGSRRGETLDGIVVTKSRPNRRYLDGEKSKSVRDACLSL
jgi:hypothetical protein